MLEITQHDIHSHPYHPFPVTRKYKYLGLFIKSLKWYLDSKTSHNNNHFHLSVPLTLKKKILLSFQKLSAYAPCEISENVFDLKNHSKEMKKSGNELRKNMESNGTFFFFSQQMYVSHEIRKEKWRYIQFISPTDSHKKSIRLSVKQGACGYWVTVIWIHGGLIFQTLILI